MSMSKYKIEGRLDGADGGTLMIDRGTALVGVRPKSRHRVYELPLRDVAEMIIQRVAIAEKHEAEK